MLIHTLDIVSLQLRIFEHVLNTEKTLSKNTFDETLKQSKNLQQDTEVFMKHIKFIA